MHVSHSRVFGKQRLSFIDFGAGVAKNLTFHLQVSLEQILFGRLHALVSPSFEITRKPACLLVLLVITLQTLLLSVPTAAPCPDLWPSFKRDGLAFEESLDRNDSNFRSKSHGTFSVGRVTK